jgi:5-methylcytosine-specific restriction protein A
MAINSASWRKEKGSSSERGYTWAWTKARNAYLRDNPLCVYCRNEGRVTAADVVNHKIPHRGDQELFWDESNWESLCKRHHDSDAQMAEKSGRVRAKFDAQGRVIW